jgi:hypothetical protein
VLVKHDKEEAMQTTISANAARRVIGACVTLGVTAALAQAALAGGEPKNQAPFTRPVGDRTIQAAKGSVSATVIGQGEAKNEYPFTRVVRTG